MMKFTEFLKQLKSSDKLEHKTLCFTGDSYYFLFLFKFFSFLDEQKKLPLKFKTLIYESQEKSVLQASLTQTFLGQTNFYWLGDCTSAYNKNKIFELITLYKGPHSIAFFLNNDKISKLPKRNHLTIIELEDITNFNFILDILNFLDIKLGSKKLMLLREIFLRLESNLNLDQLYILVSYLELIKAENNFSTREYLMESIGKSSPSLNLLAKYFFEKNAKEFFNIWSQVGAQYPDMFWISFWAEKVYRAYFVVKFLEQKDFAKSKLLSFGLPYSFFRGYWKRFSLNQLSSYHDFLYTNDYKIKTGSQFCFLDYFYLNHFVN